MRYAVFSDVHSNIEALTAFFEASGALGADEYVCLGDIVGYNANPNECVEMLRRRGVRCVMGNHDSRAAGLEGAEDFNVLAAEAIEWTRSVLTDENRAFLASLPRSLGVDGRFLAVHGWIDDTDRYISGLGDAERNFKLLDDLGGKLNLVFFGHTHQGTAYVSSDGVVFVDNEAALKLKKTSKYLINPGGLGQPRDRDPRSSFVIYDSDKRSVAYHRIDYDVASAADKVIEAGLPRRLAERLRLGW